MGDNLNEAKKVLVGVPFFVHKRVRKGIIYKENVLLRY